MVVDGEPTPDSLLVEPAGDYPAAATGGAAPGQESESADWGKLVGMSVKELSPLPGTLDGPDANGYKLTEIIGSSLTALSIRPNQRPATVPYL